MTHHHNNVRLTLEIPKAAFLGVLPADEARIIADFIVKMHGQVLEGWDHGRINVSDTAHSADWKFDPDFMEEVRALAQGHPIEAIKVYRKHTQASLLEAKRVVEGLGGFAPRPKETAWFEDRSELLAFVDVLINLDAFDDPKDVAYYFEKPSKYDPEFRAWVDHGRPGCSGPGWSTFERIVREMWG